MAPAAGERFPGRRAVAGCFLVLCTTSGLGFYGLAVFLNAFSRERGWPVASISLATTVYFVVSGVAGLVVASMLRRRVDARLVMAAAGVLGALSLFALGHVRERWQLYLVYAVFGIAFAAGGLVPVTTVVTRWYQVKRSVALSVASTGLSVGGIVLTPGAKWLIDRWGIPSSMNVLALVWFAGTVPFAVLMVRSDPVALGWHPDGERVEEGLDPPKVTGTAYREAIRSRFFVCMTIAYSLGLGAQVGGIQQLVKLVEERTDASTAALATLVLATLSVVARLAGGRLITRMPMIPITAFLMGGQAVSLALLSVAGSAWSIFASIALFGMTVGNILMIQPLLVGERFGVLEYPKIFSLTSFLSMLGTAGGPLLLGYLYDRSGSYRMPYLVAASCSFVGAVVLSQSGPAGDHRVTDPLPVVVVAGD